MLWSSGIEEGNGSSHLDKTCTYNSGNHFRALRGYVQPLPRALSPLGKSRSPNVVGRTGQYSGESPKASRLGRDLTQVYETSPQPYQARIPIRLCGTQFPYLCVDRVELDHCL